MFPENGLRNSKTLVGAALVAFPLAAWSGSARAYRPFDGTDAAVAESGEVEVEWQSAGAQRDGSQTTLVAPASVVNIGFAKDWEAVFEGHFCRRLVHADEVRRFHGGCHRGGVP